MLKSPTYIANNRIHWVGKSAICIILLIALVGLMANFLSNDKPLFATYQGKNIFPALGFHSSILSIYGDTLPAQYIPWKSLEYDFVIWAPNPFRPGINDLTQVQIPPLANPYQQKVPFKHYLGTNHKGEDVLAALIYGCRNLWIIAGLAMLIATCIGISSGLLSGYTKQTGLAITRAGLISFCFSLFISVFYLAISISYIQIASQQNELALGIHILRLFLLIIVSIAIGIALKHLLSKIPFFRSSIIVPVDAMITRINELLTASPRIILIVALSAIAAGSEKSVVIILGFTSWTGISRIVRAETIKLRQTGFIEAGIALGIPAWRIMLRHILPNLAAPLWVAICIGMGNLIMMEAALSFLGIGLPPNYVGWGSLLKDAYNHPSAWWLLTLPSIFLVVTIFSFLMAGEYFQWRNRHNKKTKNS